MPCPLFIQQYDRYDNRFKRKCCYLVLRRENVGYKGTKKSTSFAAQIAAEKAGKNALNLGIKKLEGMD